MVRFMIEILDIVYFLFVLKLEQNLVVVKQIGLWSMILSFASVP
jgi:hypothetical protein